MYDELKKLATDAETTKEDTATAEEETTAEEQTVAEETTATEGDASKESAEEEEVEENSEAYCCQMFYKSGDVGTIGAMMVKSNATASQDPKETGLGYSLKMGAYIATGAERAAAAGVAALVTTIVFMN